MLPLFELNAINVQDNKPGAVLVSTIPSMEFRYVFLDNYYSLKNNECIFSIRHGLRS